MNHYKKTLTVIFIGVCLSALGGCGQKGDLYLPDIPASPNVMAEENVMTQNTTSEVANKDISSKKKEPDESDNLPASDSK